MQRDGERERERLYNLGRREGRETEAVFSLQTYYLEISPVYLRVCTRANSGFTIDLSRHVWRATGNKVGCGTTGTVTDARQTYFFVERVSNCFSLSLSVGGIQSDDILEAWRESNLREGGG